MFNILIVVLLFSTIYNYLFKKNVQSTLNCGIFAWTGISSEHFSPLLFNILGVYNDSRGGDSCGVYFNRNSIGGIGPTAKYEALVKKQKLHTTIKLGKYPIIIGHCRKASVGTVNETNIQPVLLRNAKTERLVFVQAHNGTIGNHEELAEKYNITTSKNESDSILLAKLIEKVGFKVLEEYEGSAALVMHFIKEPNVLYAFRGQSKSYSVLTEERPLHYVNIEGSGTYISSEASPLEFISNGQEAIAFKPNVVYKLVGDKVEEFQKINRENVISKKYTTYTGYNWENNSYPISRTNSDLIKIGVQRNICCSDFDKIEDFHGTEFRISYYKGFYMSGQKYAHGKFLVNDWGYLKTESRVFSEVYTLYFFHGILVPGKSAFDELVNVAKDNNVSTAIELYEQPAFSKISPTILKYSVFPFARLTTGIGCGYMYPSRMYPNNNKSKISTTFFDGNFIPLFSSVNLFFSNGDFAGYKRTGSILSITKFFNDYPEFKDKVFLNDEENIKSEPEEKILSCDDCIAKNGYPDHTDCVNCSILNAITPSHTCLTCGDLSCAYHKILQDEDGVECTSWIPEEDEESNRATLYHIIAEGISLITKDIDDLINDIEISGCKTIVQDEYNTIIDVNNKLKEIIK